MLYFRFKNWVMALMVSLLCVPFLFSNVFAQDSEQNGLDGVWRGVLDIQEHVQLVLGVTIKNDQLTLDSPNQGMFNHEPTEFAITNNGVQFTDASLSAQFTAQLKDGALVGTFTQGVERPLTLYRLSTQDLQRMTLEGSYAGNLVINPNSVLPLQLNIAVLHSNNKYGEFMATMDSPA